MRKNQSGVLLLLSLVMTSVILVTALVLSTLAIREARLSTISDRATTAYLGSEGAAEEVLYRINKQGLSDPTTLTGTSTLGNGVEVRRSVENKKEEFIYDFVAAGQPVVINLYNTELANQAGGVSSVKASTKSAGDIDYILSEWDGAVLTEIETGSFNEGFTFAGLNPTMAYELVLVPKGRDIIELTINADASVDAPTTVYVEGEFNGGQQAVQLILPKSPPWQGGVATPAICGNGGAPEGGEECDDGNTDNGDGCSSVCTIEAICGNGPPAESGEECDDGNTDNGDGCSSMCTIEAPTPPEALTFTFEVAEDDILIQSGAEVNWTLTPSNTTTLYSGDIQLYWWDGAQYVPVGSPQTIAKSSDAQKGTQSMDPSITTKDGDYKLEFYGGDTSASPYDDTFKADLGGWCGNNVIDPGEECDGTDVSIDATYSSYISNVCSPSCTYNACVTATFSNATLGINASTPLYPDNWAYYVWNNPWPLIGGVSYSTLVGDTTISGVCVANCTGYIQQSSPAYSNGGLNWRVSKIGEWQQPINPATPPSPRYNGTLQFCRP